MNGYFYHIVCKLTFDEMNILGVLSDQQANAVFKSIKRKGVQELSKLSDANFRKALYRLEANSLIEIYTRSQQHKLYISSYGESALRKQLQEEEI